MNKNLIIFILLYLLNVTIAKAGDGKERISDNEVLTDLLAKRETIVSALLEIPEPEPEHAQTLMVELKNVNFQINRVIPYQMDKYGEETVVKKLVLVSKLFLDQCIIGFQTIFTSKLLLASLMIKQPKPQFTDYEQKLITETLLLFLQNHPEFSYILNSEFNSDEDRIEYIAKLNQAIKKVESNIIRSLVRIRILMSIINGEVNPASQWRFIVDDVLEKYNNFLKRITYSERVDQNTPEFLFVLNKPRHDLEISDNLNSLLSSPRDHRNCREYLSH